MRNYRTTVTLIPMVFMLFVASAYAQQQEVTNLEQNWSEQDREYFYFADQGSRLIPYDYFLSLEQAESSQMFRDDKYLQRFGLIPTKKSVRNPQGLPIGLARNGHFLGPTCAACHTQQITYKNQFIRIDGGQGAIDLQMLLSALTNSIKTTLEDKEKFIRFQQRVLGGDANKSQQNALREALEKQYKIRHSYALENKTLVPYGYSRLDAFGAILNRALVATGEKNNTNSPNAPTSNPYLWDTPQHDYVEWNGSQSNSGVGALARNIGEVIGVFGDVYSEKSNWFGMFDAGYVSSIQVKELRQLEKVVAKLQSPTWPASFPSINQAKVKRGRILYQQHCIACHVDINRVDPLRTIKVRMSTLGEIKTDSLMAENAIFSQGKTGKFEGKPQYYSVGKPLPSKAPAIHIANNLMVGVIKNNPLQAYLAKRDAKKIGHPDMNHPPKYVDGKIVEHGQEVSNKALLAYKARPLNGIWTSAPFLHNGSVPNLYQLLLPANQRVKQFYVGSWEFDSKLVGFDTNPNKNGFLLDTALAGNSNAGHEYGTGYDGLPALIEAERWELIEYIKTL